MQCSLFILTIFSFIAVVVKDVAFSDSVLLDLFALQNQKATKLWQDKADICFLDSAWHSKSLRLARNDKAIKQLLTCVISLMIPRLKFRLLSATWLTSLQEKKAWRVKRCVSWQQNGGGMKETVKAMTKAFEKSWNVLSQKGWMRWRRWVGCVVQCAVRDALAIQHHPVNKNKC